MIRMVSSELRWFLLLCFAALLVGMYQAQSENRPRNLRIVREDAGGKNDRLVARWNPPTGGATTYWYRTRKRSSGSSNWGPWPSQYSTTTGTSVTILRPSRISEDRAVDIQIQVDAGNASQYATASAHNVWARPPAPKRKGPWPTATPKPPAKTCETLSNSNTGIVVSSPHGLGSQIQCQRLTAAGIGIARIIESGFTDAVDVWGNVQLAEVCFSQTGGAFIFLDAASSPRSELDLDGYVSRGMVCAEIDRPGSVVLIPSTETLPVRQPVADVQEERTIAAAPVADVAPQAATTMSSCWAWTRHIVNLRAAPVDGEILARIPYDVSLRVVAGTAGWYQVEWQGVLGWVSRSLVTIAGVCS